MHAGLGHALSHRLATMLADEDIGHDELLALDLRRLCRLAGPARRGGSRSSGGEGPRSQHERSIDPVSLLHGLFRVTGLSRRPLALDDGPPASCPPHPEPNFGDFAIDIHPAAVMRRASRSRTTSPNPPSNWSMRQSCVFVCGEKACRDPVHRRHRDQRSERRLCEDRARYQGNLDGVGTDNQL